MCIRDRDWTAPDDGDYDIIYYWQVGTAQVSKPAVETSYCINYFDRRGFEALKEYWEEHVLCDEELNAKIKDKGGRCRALLILGRSTKDESSNFW